MESMSFAQTATMVASLGFSIVFGLFVMVMVSKYAGPFLSLGRDFVEAVNGLKAEVKTNRENCGFVQGLVREDVQGIVSTIAGMEGRLEQRLDEVQKVGISTLRNVEAINTKMGNPAAEVKAASN